MGIQFRSISVSVRWSGLLHGFDAALQGPAAHDEKLLGITDQLVDHVKSFCIDTFKKFPLQEQQQQQQFEVIFLSGRSDMLLLFFPKSRNLRNSDLCYALSHLKERQFWRIYFVLVNNHVSEYELRAVQVAKLRRMAMENEEPSDTTSAIEVEMGETRKGVAIASSAP